MNPITREMLDRVKSEMSRAREEALLREPSFVTNRDEIEALAEMLWLPTMRAHSAFVVLG